MRTYTFFLPPIKQETRTTCLGYRTYFQERTPSVRGEIFGARKGGWRFIHKCASRADGCCSCCYLHIVGLWQCMKSVKRQAKQVDFIFSWKFELFKARWGGTRYKRQSVSSNTSSGTITTNKLYTWYLAKMVFNRWALHCDSRVGKERAKEIM